MKMYDDEVCRLYWWPELKIDVLDVVSICLVCQLVKAEHMRPRVMLLPLLLLEWKWNCITCDFVTVLRLHNANLIQSAHFIPIETVTTLAGLCREHIIKLHGCREILCLTKIRSSLLCFGLHYKESWVQRPSSVWHIPFNQTCSESELFRSLKTCSYHLY